jgi:hypothetical protein
MNALLFQSNAETNRMSQIRERLASRKRHAYTEGAKLSIEPLSEQLFAAVWGRESVATPDENPTFWL